MTQLRNGPIDPVAAAVRMADLGFLADPDLPDRPGPAYLLVAMRETPTLRHFDPELVEYWVSSGGRGRAAMVTYTTPMPIHADFSWGLIRITDRLAVTNEYLTFGGHLEAADVDGVVILVFTSPAPLLRRGGHSQGWDAGAVDLGAFFGRLMIAVDYAPGFEAQVSSAAPECRYAAFLADLGERYRRSPELRSARGDLWHLIGAESARLQRELPDAWAAGLDLRAAAGIAS